MTKSFDMTLNCKGTAYRPTRDHNSYKDNAHFAVYWPLNSPRRERTLTCCRAGFYRSIANAPHILHSFSRV